jgi:hypothetical protein
MSYRSLFECGVGSSGGMPFPYAAGFQSTQALSLGLVRVRVRHLVSP